MRTKSLLDSGLLNTGEPRHYNSWSLSGVPKLNQRSHGSVGQALYRRQKAHAPQIKQFKHSINQIIYAIRTTKRPDG